MARAGAPRIARCEQNVCRRTCTPSFRTWARRAARRTHDRTTFRVSPSPFVLERTRRLRRCRCSRSAVARRDGQRDKPQPSPLRRRDVPVPLGPMDAHLALGPGRCRPTRARSSPRTAGLPRRGPAGGSWGVIAGSSWAVTSNEQHEANRNNRHPERAGQCACLPQLINPWRRTTSIRSAERTIAT